MSLQCSPILAILIITATIGVHAATTATHGHTDALIPTRGTVKVSAPVEASVSIPSNGSINYGSSRPFTIPTTDGHLIFSNIDAEEHSNVDPMIVTTSREMWFSLMIGLIPLLSGLSYLIIRHRRRETVFFRLQALARQYVWNQLNPEMFQKGLKDLKKQADADTRERIDEYIPYIVAFERAARAREEIELGELQR